MSRSSALLLSMHVLSTCACCLCVRSVSAHTPVSQWRPRRAMQHWVWLTKGYRAEVPAIGGRPAHGRGGSRTPLLCYGDVCAFS